MAFRAGKCLLRQRLREAKMTQQDLAHRMNKSRSQISQYVNGTRTMSLETARTIAHIVGCTMEQLYDWTWE
ncbi:helix-turn-helix transcriptional regulator [Aneurinibacillus soli]|uniref:helix-turn-helix transcriptional regulator n=2 Tax=Aneurinibacillus soli TaxID=1500254 RepID=UPI000BBB3D62|nr:helix-turn-helix transcriptional regulator [Aneurinibacillus soli]